MRNVPTLTIGEIVVVALLICGIVALVRHVADPRRGPIAWSRLLRAASLLIVPLLVFGLAAMFITIKSPQHGDPAYQEAVSVVEGPALPAAVDQIPLSHGENGVAGPELAESGSPDSTSEDGAHAHVEPPPGWLNQPDGLQGDVYGITVQCGPYSTRGECRQVMQDQLLAAVNRHVDELIEPGAHRLLDIDLPYIHENLLTQDRQYLGLHQSPSLGPMWQMYARLEFDDEDRADLEARWEQQVTSRRLTVAAAWAVGTLALLAAFYGYLQLDTATKGYYTRRLQLATALVILAVVLAVVAVQP